MTQKSEVSKESLLSENEKLRGEVDHLKKEIADLEMMIQMNAEHSDHLEDDLLDKVEATLRESEKRFRLITETIPVPIMITRLSDSMAVYVNEHLCTLIGLPHEKLLGYRSLDFLYDNPDDRQGLLDTFARQGYLKNYELKWKRANNNPAWVSLFSQLLTYNDEPCLLSALYDMTESKLAEEEIRNLKEALEQQKKEREGKYLIFMLADESYGINISNVKEIIGMNPITPIPNVQSFIKGVINLRGRVIPVLDLRLRFDLPPTDHTERTCIIISEIKRESGNMLIGMIVDTVSEVLNIKADDIEDAPEFGIRLNTDYILGMAKTGDGIKILLNMKNILDKKEMNLSNLKGPKK